VSGRFDRDTRVVAAGGVLRAEVDANWSAHLGAHGGYVTAIALRALAAVAAEGRREPRSIDVHLLEPVRAGAVELDARLERRGQTLSTASVRALQEGATVAVATATFAEAADGLDHAGLVPPDVPGPEGCAPLIEAPGGSEVAQYVEYRSASEPLPLSGGDRAEISVWMRLVEDRPADAFSAAFLVDAAVPVLLARLTTFVPIPTVELTAHFGEAAGTDSPWVLGAFRTLRAGDGFAVEDGELWSEDGRLLLAARQLRRVLLPAAVEALPGGLE
jgi:acyl-CoA thioesterase